MMWGLPTGNRNSNRWWTASFLTLVKVVAQIEQRLTGKQDETRGCDVGLELTREWMKSLVNGRV